jgi:hypothetical protein
VFLVENLFHDNLVEEQILLDDKNLQKIAIIQRKALCERYGFAHIVNNVDLWIGSHTAVVDGEAVSNYFTDTTPFLTEDPWRTMIPLRSVFETLGFNVHWTEENQLVEVTNAGKSIKLWIDKNFAEVNGETVVIDQAPTIVNNKTVVPVSFIAKNLGFKVNWDAGGKKVSLSRIGNFI